MPSTSYCRAGEPAEAAVFAERIAAMPSTVQRTLVQARWAAMDGRHNQVDALARSVWDEGDAVERASAAALLAQLAVLRNDNAGAVRWAKEADADGDACPGRWPTRSSACKPLPLACPGRQRPGWPCSTIPSPATPRRRCWPPMGSCEWSPATTSAPNAICRCACPVTLAGVPALGWSPGWPDWPMSSTAAGPGTIRNVMQSRLFRWSTTPTRGGCSPTCMPWRAGTGRPGQLAGGRGARRRGDRSGGRDRRWGQCGDRGQRGGASRVLPRRSVGGGDGGRGPARGPGRRPARTGGVGVGRPIRIRPDRAGPLRGRRPDAGGPGRGGSATRPSIRVGHRRPDSG